MWLRASVFLAAGLAVIAAACGPAGPPREIQVDDEASWKQRFRAPVVLYTQIAKARLDRGLAASNRSGVYQLYAWDVPSGELRQLTQRPEGQLLGYISPDGRFVYYLNDEQGNEIGHWVRAPFEGGAPEDVTPRMAPYSSFQLEVSQSGNLIGTTAAGADGFQVVVIDALPESALGAPRKLYQSKSITMGPFLSCGGEIAVVASTEKTATQHYSLLALDTNTGKRIAELWDGPESSLQALAFAPRPNDFRLLATSNQTGARRPLIWNPRSGERTDLALEELDGEVVPVDWSADGERILLSQFHRARQQLFIYDLGEGKLTRLNHPGGTFGLPAGFGAYFGPGGEIFTQWTDSTHPSRLIALDAETGVRTRTLLKAGDVPESRPWESVAFASSDGEEIQGWLGLPEGKGPFPAILDTHGGPEAVTTETFSPASQAWLDHGFAYLTINYRGSTTFGREFQEKIWGDLGHWEVEDMVAAREWLVEQKIARPSQVFLTGWSYGGYLTLQALGKQPGLWAGGMAGIAIADWTALYEDSAETLRGYLAAIFGGLPAEKAPQYAAGSPITYAENVKAPVLIIQGRNDTRTPARQIEMYEQKMKSLGKDIEVHWFDTGHVGSFAKTELSIEHQLRMLLFSYSVLQGPGDG